MQILGIEYAVHEVYDLIYYIILIMCFPIGLTKQFYLVIKDNLEAQIKPVTVDNKKLNKNKKKKSKLK
ncbi:MAG: hypothetical protein HY934_00920 [Candidatus Firestonebacteria bacterium]|nr:hypothetical protein [Candidatus Firestonebacteria bacterium]